MHQVDIVARRVSQPAARKWRENEEMEKVILFQFPHSISISSSFPHSLSISSQPGCKAAAGCDTLRKSKIMNIFS